MPWYSCQRKKLLPIETNRGLRDYISLKHVTSSIKVFPKRLYINLILQLQAYMIQQQKTTFCIIIRRRFISPNVIFKNIISTFSQILNYYKKSHIQVNTSVPAAKRELTIDIKPIENIMILLSSKIKVLQCTLYLQLSTLVYSFLFPPILFLNTQLGIYGYGKQQTTQK